MVRSRTVAAVGAGLLLGSALSPWFGARAQTSVSPSAQGPGVVTGQQNNQPSINQNQTQQQTDMSQQPPEAHVLPPTNGSQSQPNPQPTFSR